MHELEAMRSHRLSKLNDLEFYHWEADRGVAQATTQVAQLSAKIGLGKPALEIVDLVRRHAALCHNQD